jgi:hypothetical protein
MKQCELHVLFLGYVIFTFDIVIMNDIGLLAV